MATAVDSLQQDAELVVDVCMSVEEDDVVTIITDDEHREQAADDEHRKGIEEVLLADDLVVGRKDVLAPEGGRGRVNAGNVDRRRRRDGTRERQRAGQGAHGVDPPSAASPACSASHFWKSSGLSTVTKPFIR